MMKTKPIWTVFIFLLAFTLVQGFQRAEAAVVGSDTTNVTVTATGGLQGPEVDAYDITPYTPLTIGFGTIDASSADYHLTPDANLGWSALPGSWELTVYYAGAGDQVQIASGPNTGALLSVAIGFELDDAAAVANPPTDITFGDGATYRIISLGSVLKHVLADGTSLIVGGPNDGNRKFGDMGVRPFVLAASTKNGRVFNGAYSGVLTFDLDNGL